MADTKREELKSTVHQIVVKNQYGTIGELRDDVIELIQSEITKAQEQNLEDMKPVPSFPFYLVTTMGRVYSVSSGRFLATQRSKKTGYPQATLIGETRKNFNVHLLVANAFIPKPDTTDKLYVNHIDGDKSNNNVKNLEWVTNAENINHAFRTGLNTNRGENHHNSKLTAKDVEEIRSLVHLKGKKGIGTTMIAKKYGITKSNILSIWSGNSWSEAKRKEIKEGK